MGNLFRLGLAIVFALVLLSIVLAAYLGLYAYSASRIEARDVGLVRVEDFSMEGFSLLGYVELYNGGLIPVSVDSVDYRLILEDGGVELAKGSIEGGSIPVKESVNRTFTTNVKWTPTAETALRILKGDETFVKLQGSVHVKRLLFIDVSVPFEYRLDINAYIRELVEAHAKNILGDLLDMLGI
ncbi:MAG: LEA type 2 family protein [Candidatus Altiarchaeota archaeon]|nr:LEA type 2 family protein [Candidatus Altiarchaeota archaeon]